MKLKLLRQIEKLEQKAEKGEGVCIMFADVDAKGNQSEPQPFMTVRDGQCTYHNNSKLED